VRRRLEPERSARDGHRRGTAPVLDYLRLVGFFPDDGSFGIPASSFPRSGASSISRAVRFDAGTQLRAANW
jgi:hypothetical protein